MADDEGDWFGGGDDEPPPAVKPLKKKGDEEEVAPAAEAEGETPAEGEEAAPAEGEKREEAEDEWLDPDKLILFKHWIRKNYYDDVIDYLDKRASGITRDIPHAQTWAERILRTKSNKLETYRLHTKRRCEDQELVEKTRTSGNFFHYHVKNLFDKQFSPLLY